MKSLRTVAFIVFVFVVSSCINRSNNKGGKVDGSIVGKWQPVSVEMKGVPKMLQDQMVDNWQESILDEKRKTGWIEINADSTFLIMDSANERGFSGKWTFNGKTLSFIPGDGENAVFVDGVEIKFSYLVEELSKNEMKVDFASMYKAMVGIEQDMPIPALNMKILITHKRID